MMMPWARGLGDDVDKGLGAQLHGCQRVARHAARAVQDQGDVGGIADNIRRGREGQPHPQRPVAVDAVGADHLVGICDTYSTASFWGFPVSCYSTLLPLVHAPAGPLG